MRNFLIFSMVVLLLAPSCRQVSRGEEETSDEQARENVEAVPNPLKVSRVTLYQNGIGYIERHGTFDGKEMTFSVRPDQVNDVLTSLTVIEHGSGKGVSSVSLPVEKTTARRMAELPDQVQREGGMLAVLYAFRGASCEVSHSGGTTTGRIVSRAHLPGRIT